MSKIKNHVPGIIIATVILAVGGYYSGRKQSDEGKTKQKIIHYVPEYGSKIAPNFDGSVSKSGKIFCEKPVGYDAPEPVWVKRKDLTKRYKLSMTYLIQHEYKKCVEISQEIVKSEPRFGLAYNGMAFCQLALHDLDGAEQSYHQVLKLEPDSLEGLSGLGAVASARNDHALAIKYYQRAVANCMGDPLSHWSLASEYYMVGNYDRAAEEYKLYISLSNNPKSIATAKKMLEEIDKLNQHKGSE